MKTYTIQRDATFIEQARGGLWDIGLIGHGSGSQLMQRTFDARVLRKVEPTTAK